MTAGQPCAAFWLLEPRAGFWKRGSCFWPGPMWFLGSPGFVVSPGKNTAVTVQAINRFVIMLSRWKGRREWFRRVIEFVERTGDNSRVFMGNIISFHEFSLGMLVKNEF